MRVATIVSLGASALLGVGALVVAKTWLPDGTGQGKAAASVAPAQNLIPVVAAKADIPFGVKLTSKDLMIIKLPKDAVPDGTYSTIDAVTALDNGGPVTLARFSAREPMLPAKLSGGGVKANVAAVIGEGMRAYTIKVTDVSGGGGHVTPGDRVDVLVAMEPSEDVKVEGAGGKAGAVSGAVLQNVKVLGMDLIADPANVDKFIPKTATLEVSLEDAAKLAVAAQVGELSLALRRTGSVELAEAAPVRTLTWTSKGLAPAPVGAAKPVRRAAGPRRPAAARAPEQHTLTVVQGSERVTVQVPTDRLGGY